MTNLDRPIFIVGTGRCGSTMLSKILAKHPNLSFLTTASVVFPSQYHLQKFILSIWDKPLLGPLLRMRLIAGEAWPFWDQFMAGFSMSFRDIRADDITAKQKSSMQKEIPNLLSKKRNRLLIKFTGWTRIGFIKEVFPDAKIVHIIRDPRAVINSMLHIDFWKGRHGPYNLNWGGLNHTEMEIWDRHNQSFITLSAIEYKRIINAYNESLVSLSDDAKKDILELSYSNICDNYESQICKVLDFCDLEPRTSFMKLLKLYKVKNQNDKWKSYLTKHQQHELEVILEELNLKQYYNN